MNNSTPCPKCGNLVEGTFPYQCPFCTFNLSALTGQGTASYQVMKWQKHSDLLYGRDIQLAPNEKYNASFDFNGYAKLDDIVRFTITYGDRVTFASRHGAYQNLVILSYIPEQLGAGTAIHFPGTVPCSGICLISPQSENYAHSFPVIDEWVQSTFANRSSKCRICNRVTAFGQPICDKCYLDRDSDWRNFL